MSDLVVNEGDAPTLLFPDVTLNDAEGDFDGGILRLGGLLAEDVVSLHDVGVGAGQIGYDGAAITYSGTVIGTATGGDGDTFTVTLNPDATVAAVEAMIEQLTYANTSHSPTLNRVLTLGLTDASGAELKGPLRLTEVTTADGPFYGVAVGNYSHPAFGDIDGDGDLDVFVSQETGGLVNYFENIGSRAAPVFVQRTGGANPLDGVTGHRIKPVLVDIDADGDLDAFIGSETGYLRFFENTGSSTAATFVESNVTFVGGGTPSDSDSNGSNETYIETAGDVTMTVVMDGNGSWLVSNVGPYGGLSGNALYFNGGSVSTVTTVTVGFSSAVPVDSFIFAEADGDNTGTQTGTYTFTPAGSGSAFSLSAADFQYGPSGGSTGYLVGMKVEPADWTAVTGFTIEFSPTDGGYFSPAMDTVILGLPVYPFQGVDVGDESSPAFVDLDGDGDLDALVGDFDGDLHYFENTGDAGNPVFSERSGGANPFNGLIADGSATPAFVDIDGDGDLDLFLGGYLGQVQFFRNIGTATAPAFVEVSGEENPFDGVNFSNRSAPAFADLDDDGFLDALVGEWTGALNFFAGGSGTSVTVTVMAVNDAPAIAGVPASTVDEGQTYSFTPTASDPDGDPLVFSIANAPPWASFDSTTGTLSGTPDDSHVGIYGNIVITVDDGTTTSTLPAFSIEVVNVVAAPSPGGSTGVYTNPVIPTYRSLEDVTLRGFVTNRGLIRNVELLGGTVVQGGRVAGTITGDPSNPAIIDATVEAGAILSNVVIGANAILEAGVILGPNVSFESLDNIPPGFDLSSAQGLVPWTHEGSRVLALDLHRSLLTPGPDALTLLRSIQLVEMFQASGARVESEQGAGEFTVIIDGRRSRLVPVDVRRAPEGSVPGAFVDENGNLRIVTVNGLVVTSYPVVDDVFAFRDALRQVNPLLDLSFDANANIVVRGGDASFYRVGRGDILIAPAPIGSTPGLKLRSLDSPAGVVSYSLVYEGEDGELYEQAFSPVPADWAALKPALQALPDSNDVRIDTAGFISLNAGGQVYRGRTGHRVTRGDGNESSDGGVRLIPVGDRNGDGRHDLNIVYANGDVQVLYILP